MNYRGYWADLRRPQFEALDTGRAIAILPVGAIEQHGPHLPVSVDTDLVDAVIERTLPLVGDDTSVLVLPTVAYGRSGEHDAFPGTISLSAETLIGLWKEIAAGVAHAGIRRLVLFNGHGGNTPAMEIVARDLRVSHGMITATCAWYQFNEATTLVDEDEHAFGLHGGTVETSASLAINGSRVDMEAAKDFPCRAREWRDRYRHLGLEAGRARPGWVIGDLNADGACGDAAAAAAETGEKLLANAARNFAAFLAEFDRFCGEMGDGA